MTKELKNQYFPQIAFHPGETLAEKLEELKMSNKEFAIRTGKPEKTITAIINGESSVTPDMAVIFENVLKIPAHFWMAKQRHFDEFKAREKRNELLKDSFSWMRKFPVNEMIKKGWFPEVKTTEGKTAALLNFFAVSSKSAWENYYLNQELKIAFRISLSHSKEPYAISAWLRKGEIEAEKLPSFEFSSGKLKSTLPELKKLMADHPDDFFDKLRELLLSSGVKLVCTPCLPKAPINGATRWLAGDTPLIQISGRYKRNDIFWFTIFHEIGHILLHGKKDIFLENTDFQDKEKEEEADNFAIKWTLTKEQEKEVLADLPLTTGKICEYAVKFGTHPAIIVGRLQHEGFINHNVGANLIVPIHIGQI
ncbi:MAG: HigA family addiction module antidote protein [Bacteroidetes bacterium]|nr:HigA family addiction module antidote protein [Bacteroidota bacterium]